MGVEISLKARRLGLEPKPNFRYIYGCLVQNLRLLFRLAVKVIIIGQILSHRVHTKFMGAFRLQLKNRNGQGELVSNSLYDSSILRNKNSNA